MKIENDKYYVNKILDVLYCEILQSNLRKMTPLDYIKKGRAYTVTEDGFYNASTQPYKKDIVAKIENKTLTNDILILDLFQISDYTLNKVYTTTKKKEEVLIKYKIDESAININDSKNGSSNIYPVISEKETLTILNKLLKLNKALEE